MGSRPRPRLAGTVRSLRPRAGTAGVHGGRARCRAALGSGRARPTRSGPFAERPGLRAPPGPSLPSIVRRRRPCGGDSRVDGAGRGPRSGCSRRPTLCQPTAAPTRSRRGAFPSTFRLSSACGVPCAFPSARERASCWAFAVHGETGRSGPPRSRGEIVPTVAPWARSRASATSESRPSAVANYPTASRTTPSPRTGPFASRRGRTAPIERSVVVYGTPLGSAHATAQSVALSSGVTARPPRSVPTRSWAEGPGRPSSTMRSRSTAERSEASGPAIGSLGGRPSPGVREAPRPVRQRGRAASRTGAVSGDEPGRPQPTMFAGRPSAGRPDSRRTAGWSHPEKAEIPVWARPRIKAWMSCVPS
jgi:hypothetical protein